MRKNWVMLIAFIVLSIGVLSGCTQQQTPPPGTTNTVTIKNFAFDPSTLTVSVGTNVTWTNEDSVSHQVNGENGLFESSILSSGQSYTFRFLTPGTYNYTCSIHPSMQGKIIVQ
jgi:plastocyanin